MKRIIGFILVPILGLATVILVSPFAVIALVAYGAARSLCMAKGKHKFLTSELLQGKRAEDLLCVVCRHKATLDEAVAIKEEYHDSIKKMLETKQLLDKVFATPEERAVDEIIEDSKDA